MTIELTLSQDVHKRCCILLTYLDRYVKYESVEKGDPITLCVVALPCVETNPTATARDIVILRGMEHPLFANTIPENEVFERIKAFSQPSSWKTTIKMPLNVLPTKIQQLKAFLCLVAENA